MGRRGRRPKPQRPVRVVITLSLDPLRDGDLVELLSRVPSGARAALVKAALRGADLRAFLPVPEEEAIEAALDRLGEIFEA
jgi:hypothetical protein